jgi:type I restriction enzyme M protein
MDPACGTGGFLACAFDHVKDITSKPPKTIKPATADSRRREKQLPHLLCTTNMLLHGIEVPVQIRHDNTSTSRFLRGMSRSM